MRKHFVKRLLLLLTIFVVTTTAVFAQTAPIVPFSVRATYNGRYDIKMIAAPNLEPAYINTASAASDIIKVDSIINPQTIMLTNTLLDINNRYKTFPVTASIPTSAILCPDGTAPCAAGYTITTSSSCPLPIGKWNSINYVSKTVATAYPDYDSDLSTFSSSYAYLDIPPCAEVQAAYLYWTGFKQGSNSAITQFTPTASYNGSGDVYRTGVTPNDYKTVLIKCPGMTTYSPVTAVQTYENTGGMSNYICVGDVTNIVQGKSQGNYYVGNIRSYPADGDGGSSSGWTMVIVYKSSISAPRSIVLYDGVGSVNGTSDYVDFTLTGITAPATTNFKSYLGYAVLDGENAVPELIGTSNFTATPTVTNLDGTNIPNNSAAECVRFSANGGAPTVFLNPFYGDTVRWYTKKGQPEDTSKSDLVDACKVPIFNDPTWGFGYDGASSSRISTYDEATNTNGNEIIRKPSGRYTMGYDSHMMLLPRTAIVSGTTSATMRVYAGSQGGTMPFMAFIAIETNQPRLMMYKKILSTTSPLPTSVGLGDEITYEIKVKNQGALASTGGDAYITDTLGMQSNYVVGSVNWIRGSGTFAASGSGTDAEPLSFTNLPSIAPGDSIVVTFKVTLEPMGRIDIWGIPCRRVVRNKAYLYYKPDASYTTPVETLSNGGSCGEPGADAETQVSDPVFPVIDAQFMFTKNIATEVIANPSLKIVDAVKEVLIDSAAVSNPDSYTIKDALSAVVSPAATFDTNNPIQTFTASIPVDDGIGGTCDQVYTITFILGKVPNFTLTSTDVSCNGFSDGGVNVKVTDGSTTETYSISLYAGSYSSLNPIPVGLTAIYGPFSYTGGTAIIDLGTTSGLLAGTYTAVAVPTINTSIPSYYESVDVIEPLPVSVVCSSQASVCSGKNVTVYASIYGGLGSGTKTYIWHSSPVTDPMNFDSEGPTLSNSKTVTLDAGANFYVEGFVNTCSAVSDTISISVLPSPDVDIVLAVDSGCYEYNLADLNVVENGGLTPSDYVLTFHTQNPTSATDNRFIIPQSKYLIKTKQTVWARMSINDFCYDTDPGQIYVKSMEECYPIIISSFFSPDGDGYNDRWQIEGLEEYNNPEILVYDRYGKLVFKGGKEDVLAPKGWDGTYLGNSLPSADYWYQMNFTEIKPKLGHFTLKRKKE